MPPAVEVRSSNHWTTREFSSDFINIPLPSLLGVPQEVGEAMAERTLPTNTQLPTLWLLPPSAPGSEGREKGGDERGLCVPCRKSHTQQERWAGWREASVTRTLGYTERC